MRTKSWTEARFRFFVAAYLIATLCCYAALLTM